MLNPAFCASLKKSLTVSKEKSFRFLFKSLILDKISGAIVIISEFEFSAWIILSQMLDINNIIGCFLILIGVLFSQLLPIYQKNYR